MIDNAGMSLRELVLRLDGRIDGFILAHETRHATEASADSAARGDPSQSAAGRAIMAAMSDISGDVKALGITVASHERTLQRMLGAMTLLTALGLGTTALVAFRIAGIVP